MNQSKSLAISLLLLRLSVFLVFFMWTLDKFVRPDHASRVYEHFYGSPALSATTFYVIGSLQMVLLIGFLLGIQKRITYGSLVIFHAISTFSSYKQYLAPFEKTNLLFFCAWPMLAACVALYLLREQDKLWTWGKK